MSPSRPSGEASGNSPAARMEEDLDSPTDGYFNQRPDHPRNVLVPEREMPGSDASRPAGKEAEASPKEPTEHGEGRHIRNPAYPIEEQRYTDLTPSDSIAPPTYSAATADSADHPPSHQADHHVAHEPEIYTDHPQSPLTYESRGSQDLEDDPNPSGFRPKWLRGNEPSKRRSRRRFLWVLTTLTLGLALVIGVIAGIQQHKVGPLYPTRFRTVSNGP